MAALVGLSRLPACRMRLTELLTISGTFPFVGLLTIFLSIQVLVCMCSSDYMKSPECNKPFKCGIIEDLNYPFRQRDSPEYCGEPGFELYCEGGNPMITISSRSYQVLVFNTTLKSLVVAPVSGLDNLLCSLGLVDTSLNLSPFHSAWNTNNMTLYYNCPMIANQYEGLSNYQFNCTIIGIDIVSYFVVTSVFSDLSVAAQDALRSCHGKVILPAFASILKVLEQNPSSANLGVTLENGFGLRWSENDSLSEIQTANNTRTLELKKEKLHGSFNLKRKVIIGVTVAAASIMGLICILYLIIFKNKGGSASSEYSRKHKENIDAFIKTYGSRGPNRYSRYDIKKMTNKFVEKLGQGGYGSVYKGELPNGRLVAVKVLSDSKGNGEEFLNEVASISRTSHVNIVNLLGFCYEKSKRALVYEFMPNGSLDKFIYCQGSDKSRQLEWKTLYDIALGIARGLEYLHQGCNTRILHFDIKPHNILLDENFCPKISDFGLSKLCERKESMVSLVGARGTAGYIAPEVFYRHLGGVSHKSDVYSYGMMVLEMVGGRKNIDVEVSQTSEIYFPSWIYKHLDHAMNWNRHGVTVEEEEEITRKLIVVSLWCIQSVPRDRPSMTKVLEMLQGSLQSLEIPPRPFVSSPVRSPKIASTT